MFNQLIRPTPMSPSDHATVAVLTADHVATPTNATWNSRSTHGRCWLRHRYTTLVSAL